MRDALMSFSPPSKRSLLARQQQPRLLVGERLNLLQGASKVVAGEIVLGELFRLPGRDRLGEIGEARSVEQGAQRKIDPELLAQPRRHPHRDERLTAQLEEAV